MNSLRLCLIFAALITSFSVAIADNGDPAVLTIDFNACHSDTQDGSNMDYTDINAISGTNGRVSLSAPDGGYRTKPHINTHSCTPGLNGTPAMCIGFDPFCTYAPGTSAAFRFDVTLSSPFGSDPVRLESLSFHQKAPELFSWIDGVSGVNNYPTKFGIRVLKNGVVIYERADLATTRDWNLESFDFIGDENFEVTSETVFNFELMAYCAVGIPGGLAGTVWDLEDISVIANCVGECSPLDDLGDVFVSGGDGTQYYGCVGNTELTLMTTSSYPSNLYHYFIVDDNMVIVDIISTDGYVNMMQYPPGRYLAYGYVDIGGGLPAIGTSLSQIPNNMCFSITDNAVTILINDPRGGVITGGPFEFCMDDLNMDFIPPGSISLSGQQGGNSQWVVTDSSGDLIVALPFDISDLDFESLPEGTCLIWHLSFDGWIKNLAVGGSISDLRGTSDASGAVETPPCMDISNSISVTKKRLTPGVLGGGPFTFCTGDGVADHITQSDVMLSQGGGLYNSWVLTDGAGVEILAVTEDLSSLNFDSAGQGNCALWSLTHDELMPDLIVGGDFRNLIGCSARSNFISINKLNNSGGIITSNPFEFCTGDGIPDMIPAGAVTLQDNVGANSQWLFTDMSGNIIATPNGDYSSVNLENYSAGSCLLYHLSYDGNILGLGQGQNIANLSGCYSLSNSIMVNKTDCTPLIAGSVTGGPFDYCSVDGVPDYLTGMSITGADGDLNTWLITDGIGNILHMVQDPSSFDAEILGTGSFQLYHLTYDLGLTGLMVGANINTDLVGKYALSQAISITRFDPAGGSLSDPMAVLEFCVGDGAEDRIPFSTLTLNGAAGSGSTWILTDISGQTIIDVAQDYNDFDLEDSPAGGCLLYHVGHSGQISGIVAGASISGIVGCYDLSNSLNIIKNYVDGGMLDNGLGYVQFCVGDGIPDFIPDGSVSLSGNIGDEHRWVITNTSSTEILMLPDSPYGIDFDGFEPGTCVLWNLSSIGPVPNLQIGGDFTSLIGCASRSSFISIFRYLNTGGTLVGGPFTFCVQDGIIDTIPAGAVNVVDNLGANSQWIVVDANGIITETPLDSYSDINFDQAMPGTYTLYHLSYDGPITGLGDNLPFSGLDGCLSISDGITITNEMCASLMDEIDLMQISSDNTIALINSSDESIDISEFWFSDGDTFLKAEELQNLCGENMICEAGELLILSLPFDLNLLEGSITLYHESIHEVKIMRDYVQWGATGQANEMAAINSGLWMAGESAESIAPEMALAKMSEGIDAATWSLIEPMECYSTSNEDLEVTPFMLYPNPVSDFLNIQSHNSERPVVYQIINSYGQLISKGQLNETRLKLGHLLPGSYILKLTTTKEDYNLKFQKL